MQHHSDSKWYAFLLVVCFLSALPTAAGSPQLNNILPVAAQRGQTIDVSFYGARLNDATQVLFHTTGITAGDVVFENNRVKTTFTIDPDAPIGEHQVRLLAKSGVTEMVTFRVVDGPVIREKPDERIRDTNRFRPGTSFEDPQAVELGTTVIGKTDPEDIDYYAVDLKKGQRLTVQCDAMSLGRGFTDSYLAVLNSERFEVAASDDTALLRQDPYVSFLAPADGRYTIIIRDSGYGGGSNNWYTLHIGSFPRPAVVYPLGGRPGEQATLRFIGDPAGDFDQQVKLPDQPDNGYAVLPVHEGQAGPSGHAFRVNHLPNVLEQDSAQNNGMNQLKEASAHAVPVALNGVIDQPGDMDYFKVHLKKGQAVAIRCYANTMGSPLDSVVNLFNAANNQHIQGNDDQGGSSDSLLNFTAPNDGDYYVRVRDHRNRGGTAFVYRVEVTVAQPSLSTFINRYDQNRPQQRQAIAVPQGNRYAALVRVSRSRVGGDLTPLVEGMPAGVSVKGLGTGEVGGLMPVVFEAAGDAPLGASMADIGVQSRPKGDSAERITGRFSQRTAIVQGNPNRTEYAHTTLDTMPVAVTQAVPFKIDVTTPKAPIVRDGVMKLKVNVSRDGYDGRVRLYQLWRPTGIGAAGMVELKNGSTEARYYIDANNSTPLRTWPMVIVGYADLPGGPVWISSDIIDVRVEMPFVTGRILKAKCTQGEAVDVVVKLEHPREWAGEGEIKLLGLPAACTVEPVKVKPGQEEAVFRVQTAGNTPPGQHKSLMAELTVTVNGEPVVHRIGRGAQLRIDRPRKPDAQARKDGK